MLFKEWQIIDLACHAYAKVTVALYDTLGQDSVGENNSSLLHRWQLTWHLLSFVKEYMYVFHPLEATPHNSPVNLLCSCNHADLSIVFISANHLPTLLALAPRLSYLKVIVCIDELEPSSDAALLSKAWASNLDIELFTFSECELTINIVLLANHHLNQSRRWAWTTWSR